MKVPVRSVLFKRVTQINIRMLLGLERGQYDLRLSANPALGEFFSSTPITGAETDLGGWTKVVQLQPLTGRRPVPSRSLDVRYMGADSSRKDYNLPSQTTEPYDLWAPGRAFDKATDPAELDGAIALIIKDINNGYHARWVRKADTPSLPANLRAAIDSEKTGVWNVPTSIPTDPLSPVAQQVLDALYLHHNVLLYGPPATGKTHIVREVMAGFRGTGVNVDTDQERRPLSEGGDSTLTAWSTFHQSYSYEDFIVGLRPSPNVTGGFTLEPVPGVLLELAEWARGSTRSSLLVIDEINRGNVSRIFGEFITLLEPDKRLADDGTETPSTVTVRLPYVQPDVPVKIRFADGATTQAPTPFSMPLRVYTLATMNSVDKSVAPLDAALRRRFHLVNLAPDLLGMQERLGIEATVKLDASGVPAALTNVTDIKQLALVVLAQLNRAITVFLGQDFQFGEWYLAALVASSSVQEARTSLADIWRTALMPQLEEYFLGRADQLLALLGPSAKSSAALVVDEPTANFEELGASTSVRGRRDATDPQIFELLQAIAASNL